MSQIKVVEADIRTCCLSRFHVVAYNNCLASQLEVKTSVAFPEMNRTHIVGAYVDNTVLA